MSLHKVPSAYPAECGIQREADLFNLLLNVYKKLNGAEFVSAPLGSHASAMTTKPYNL